MSVFGFKISADGIVTRETEFRDATGCTWTRHQRLADQRPQRFYFSRPGPVSWEPTLIPIEASTTTRHTWHSSLPTGPLKYVGTTDD